MLTTLLSLAFMFASFCFLYWASYKRKEARAEGGDDECPPGVVTRAQAIVSRGVRVAGWLAGGVCGSGGGWRWSM